MSPDAAWELLNAELQDYKPPCSGLPLFVADSRTDEQRAACASICRWCAISGLCNHYATAAADSGFWAGSERSPKRRHATTTTDARAVSPAPIKRRDTQ